MAEKLRFNLPGPDMTHEDLGRWINEALAGAEDGSGDPVDPNVDLGDHIIVIDCPGAGMVLKGSSRAGRIIICGSRSDQPYSTRFSDFFVPALSEPLNDINTDGGISVLEAFQAAVREIDDMYLRHSLMKTENALLEDNGDGDPSQQPWRFVRVGNDGRAASSSFLEARKEQKKP